MWSQVGGRARFRYRAEDVGLPPPCASLSTSKRKCTPSSSSYSSIVTVRRSVCQLSVSAQTNGWSGVKCNASRSGRKRSASNSSSIRFRLSPSEAHSRRQHAKVETHAPRRSLDRDSFAAGAFIVVNPQASRTSIRRSRAHRLYIFSTLPSNLPPIALHFSDASRASRARSIWLRLAGGAFRASDILARLSLARIVPSSPRCGVEDFAIRFFASKSGFVMRHPLMES